MGEIQKQENEPSSGDIREMKKSFMEGKRTNATELQRETAQQQAEMLELTLYDLMRRTNDNPEIVNALRDIIVEIGNRGAYGRSDKPLAENLKKKLIEDLSEALEKLREKRI